MRLLIAATLVAAAALAGCAGGGDGGEGAGDGSGVPTPTTVTNRVSGSPIPAPNPFAKPTNASPTPASPAPATPTSTTPTPASPTPASPTPEASTASVEIVGFAFSPREASIAVGDTLEWTNADGAAHTATADDGSFDSGRLAEGATFSHTFDAAGTYAYACAIHPSMTGTVTVA